MGCLQANIMRGFVAASGLLGSACLYQGDAVSIAELPRTSDASMVNKFPVVLQDGDQDCGVAAVSALLTFWGQPASPNLVREWARVPPEHPVKAGALKEVLRQRGYEAYLLRADQALLEHELARGRPVLVGMLKPVIGKQTFAHYEVLVGKSSSQFFTMDPAAGFRKYPLEGFLQEWEATGYVAMVMAPGRAG